MTKLHALALVLFAAACSPARPPASARDWHPASLWSLRISSKLKWKRLEGDSSESVHYVVNTKAAYGRIALRTWDMAWPDDADAFRAKLSDPLFFHNGFRYAMTTTAVSEGEWLFRGKRLPAAAGQAVRAFVMVLTVEGARFVCLSMSEAGDEDDIAIELEACRSIRVKE